eukprot:10471404-Alexandrium_andersonii.AAC.1
MAAEGKVRSQGACAKAACANNLEHDRSKRCYARRWVCNQPDHAQTSPRTWPRAALGTGGPRNLLASDKPAPALGPAQPSGQEAPEAPRRATGESLHLAPRSPQNWRPRRGLERLETRTDARTDRQADRQTDTKTHVASRHVYTDTQTHRHTDTQTHRQAGAPPRPRCERGR